VESREDRLKGLLAQRAALKAKDRRDAKRSPLLFFSTRLRPAQTAFFRDANKASAVLSGNQAGKDECMVVWLNILFGRGKYLPRDMPWAFDAFRDMPAIAYGTPLSAWYCVPELDLWRSVIVPKILKYAPRELLDSSKSADPNRPGYNRGDETIYWRDGSTITGKSYTGFRQDKGKSEGHPLDAVGMSEVPPEWLFDEAWSRTLSTSGKIRVVCTRNEKTCHYPMAWIRRRIIRAPKGSGMSHHFFSTYENQMALAQEADEAGFPEVAAAHRLNWQRTWDSLSPEDRAVQLGGEWSGMGGIVYKVFDENLHNYNSEASGRHATPADFIALRDNGYGRIFAAMDHGCAHATCIAYFFVCTEPVPALELVEGDHIIIGEYRKEGWRVPQHIPLVKERHDVFKPEHIRADRHMWDAEATGQPPIVQMYGEALYGKGQPHGFVSANNVANTVTTGVNRVTTMLMPRIGNYPWPQLRMLREDIPFIWEAFFSYQEKANAKELSGDDKFREEYADEMDTVRYGCTAYWEGHRPPQREEQSEVLAMLAAIRARQTSGVPGPSLDSSLMCSLVRAQEVFGR